MAKYQAAVLDLPMTACGDLNSYQYFFVRCASTNGRIQVANGASGPMPLGVLQNDPRDLEEATVRVWGTSKVKFCTENAVGYGDWVVSGSAGTAEEHSGSIAATGIAMEDVVAGASTYAEVLLFPVSTNVTDNTA